MTMMQVAASACRILFFIEPPCDTYDHAAYAKSNSGL